MRRISILPVLVTCLVVIGESSTSVVAFTQMSCTTTQLYSSSSTEEQLDRPINIEENTPRDIESFENWAYNYGIQRDPGKSAFVFVMSNEANEVSK